MAQFLIFALLFLITNINADPEQIHLAFTGIASERIVNYVTKTGNSNSTIPTVVRFGKDPDKLDHQNEGHSYFYDMPDSKGRSLEIHNVKMTGLDPNSTYYYQVGDPESKNGGMSDVYSFATYEKQMKFAVFGDMGYKNAVSLPLLTSEAKAGKYQAVLHVGDLAYDFYEYHGNNGDDFMNSIQPVATVVPYMVLPGNHEHRFNFSHYQNRFSNMEYGVGQTSGSDTSLWYSFDSDLIHFVAFDTEVFSYYSDDGQIQRQLNWLEQDLAKANANRDKVPWIVSLAHKSDFMERTNFTDISPLLHKYGVDVHFCGHSHNYQRHFPYYEEDVDTPEDSHVYVNPKYMSVIVAGSAGSKERISKGLGPEKHLAVHVFDYGYGHLQAVNRTHLHWVWENAAVEINEKVQDYLWVIQENHGMRLTV